MAIKRLEARLTGSRLKVYDVDEFSRRYLGFVKLNLRDFSLDHLRYSALVLYSKKHPSLKRIPKFEIKIMYGEDVT